MQFGTSLKTYIQRKNVYKRRKHTALEQKQVYFDDVTKEERKEHEKRKQWFNIVLDYENEIKRTWNTMVETTS